MKRRTWIIVAVVAVIAAGGGAVAWFLRDDAPARVSITEDQAAPTQSSAVSTGDGTTAPTSSAASSGGDTTANTSIPAGVDGTWTLADGEENFAGFRIDEELTGIGANTVVGRTPAVTASFDVQGATVSATTVEADMTQITTDSDRRNQAIRTLGLETDRFPAVSFTQSGPVQLSSVPAVGETVSASIAGELTLHGVTNPVTVDVQAELREANLIKVVGTQTIVLTDYGMTKPVVGPVLSIADTGDLELQLFFAR